MEQKDNINYREIAMQLRCPHGKEAAAFSESMFQSNKNLIFKTIDALALYPQQTILEIGFGSGLHLSYLFQKERSIKYWGIDTSEAMVAYAAKVAEFQATADKIKLMHTEASGYLSFEDAFFDGVFTANTLYFMKNPALHFQEVLRVLKPGAQFVITFVQKDFGERLPFTAFGFTLYTTDEVKKLLMKVGFKSILCRQDTHVATSNDGTIREVPFVIFTAIKPQKDTK